MLAQHFLYYILLAFTTAVYAVPVRLFVMDQDHPRDRRSQPIDYGSGFDVFWRRRRGQPLDAASLYDDSKPPMIQNYWEGPRWRRSQSDLNDGYYFETMQDPYGTWIPGKFKRAQPLNDDLWTLADPLTHLARDARSDYSLDDLLLGKAKRSQPLEALDWYSPSIFPGRTHRTQPLSMDELYDGLPLKRSQPPYSDFAELPSLVLY